jgi:hypothetical protein
MVNGLAKYAQTLFFFAHSILICLFKLQDVYIARKNIKIKKKYIGIQCAVYNIPAQNMFTEAKFRINVILNFAYLKKINFFKFLSSENFHSIIHLTSHLAFFKFTSNSLQIH